MGYFDALYKYKRQNDAARRFWRSLIRNTIPSAAAMCPRDESERTMIQEETQVPPMEIQRPIDSISLERDHYR